MEVPELLLAVEQSRRKDVIHFAHKLKGYCLNIGVRRFGQILEYIEMNRAEVQAEWNSGGLKATIEREHAEAVFALEALTKGSAA